MRRSSRGSRRWRSRTSRGSSLDDGRGETKRARRRTVGRSCDRERRFPARPDRFRVGLGREGGVDGAKREREDDDPARAARKLPLAAGTRYVGPGAVLGELDQERARFAGPESLLDAFCREAVCLRMRPARCSPSSAWAPTTCSAPARRSHRESARVQPRAPFRARCQLPPPRRADEPPRPPGDRGARGALARYDGTVCSSRTTAAFSSVRGHEDDRALDPRYSRALSYGRSEAKNLQVPTRQAPRDAPHRSATRERVPAVPPAQAAASRVPYVWDVSRAASRPLRTTPPRSPP